MMKKLSFLILCILGLTQLQAEQEAPFTYHMGMHFGQNFADNNSKMRDNALYGIRGTVMLTPFYGLVLGYDRLDSIDLKDTSATTDVQRLYGLIEVDGEEQFHVVPYITFGAGYEILSKDVVVNGHKYDISQAYLTGGLGFRYNFIPEMSIFLEGNALWKTDTTDVDYSAIAGFMYHFNATTCDKTYITDRLREKPKERTTIHTGAVNAISGWKKPTLSHKKTPFRKTAFTQKKWENPAPVQKRPVYRHKYVNPKRVVHFRPKNRQNNGYHNGYYVVLGAFKTKRGMHTLLRRLDRKGIPYILKDNRRKRLTYVLCGVYPNQYRAQRALKRLKAVQHDAYIKRMR